MRGVLLSTVFFFVILTGCSHSRENVEEIKQQELEKTNNKNKIDSKNKKDEAQAEADIDHNFGSDYKESGSYVAYHDAEDRLILFHKLDGKEIVLEDTFPVTSYEWYDHYLYYIVKTDEQSERVPIQSLYRVDTSKRKIQPKSLFVGEVENEHNSFSSFASFDINKDGEIAYVLQLGFLESNYWYDYYITDVKFKKHDQILRQLGEYESVMNDFKWSDKQIPLVIDLLVQYQFAIYDSGEVHILIDDVSPIIGEDIAQIQTVSVLNQDKYEVTQYNEDTAQVERYELDIVEKTYQRMPK